MSLLKRETARLRSIGINLEVHRNGHGVYLSDPTLQKQDCGMVFPMPQDAVAAAVAGARPTLYSEGVSMDRHPGTDAASTLDRLRELARETDPHEDKPTEYAIKGIFSFLEATGRDIPLAAVAANEDGAIYVFWRRPAKKLQLVFPASSQQQPYLSIRIGNEHDFISNVTPDQLAERLAWLSVAD